MSADLAFLGGTYLTVWAVSYAAGTLHRVFRDMTKEATDV